MAKKASGLCAQGGAMETKTFPAIFGLIIGVVLSYFVFQLLVLIDGDTTNGAIGNKATLGFTALIIVTFAVLRIFAKRAFDQFSANWLFASILISNVFWYGKTLEEKGIPIPTSVFIMMLIAIFLIPTINWVIKKP